MRRLALAMILLLAPSPIIGAEEPATPVPSTAPGTRRALVVCGLPGDPEHRALYAGVIEQIVGALVDRSGFRAPDVWVRFGAEPEGDGSPEEPARFADVGRGRGAARSVQDVDAAFLEPYAQTRCRERHRHAAVRARGEVLVAEHCPQRCTRVSAGNFHG